MTEHGLREYVLTAVVTLDASACAAVTSAYLDGTRSLCVVQPAAGVYMPARISVGVADAGGRQGSSLPCVLRIRLADWEAAHFFSQRQRFALWSDAFVGQTVRGEGLVGYGVITAGEARSPVGAAALELA